MHNLLDYCLWWTILSPELHSLLDYSFPWFSSLKDYPLFWITPIVDYSLGLFSLLDSCLCWISFFAGLASSQVFPFCWIILSPGQHSLLDYSFLHYFLSWIPFLLDYTLFPCLDYPPRLHSFLDYPLRWTNFFPGIPPLLDYMLSSINFSDGLPFFWMNFSPGLFPLL